jgi:hypothetical protein
MRPPAATRHLLSEPQCVEKCVEKFLYYTSELAVQAFYYTSPAAARHLHSHEPGTAPRPLSPKP